MYILNIGKYLLLIYFYIVFCKYNINVVIFLLYKSPIEKECNYLLNYTLILTRHMPTNQILVITPEPHQQATCAQRNESGCQGQSILHTVWRYIEGKNFTCLARGFIWLILVPFWEVNLLTVHYEDKVHLAFPFAVTVPSNAWLMQLLPKLHLNSYDHLHKLFSQNFSDIKDLKIYYPHVENICIICL